MAQAAPEAADAKVTVAVPKGRVLEQALPVLAGAGLRPAGGESALRERSIVVDTDDPGVRLIIVRAADVQTYVSHGAAQVGLVGRDLLLESPVAGLVHGADVGIARCRLVVAAQKGFDLDEATSGGSHLTVATKYPRLARRLLSERGIQAEIVRLYGTMELAPTVGLSDVIVDLVETGETLRANDLVAVMDLLEVSTHVVMNQAASWRRRKSVGELAARLAKARD